MIDSKLHVVTRLDGRDNITQEDIDIQKQVFDDMLMIIAQ
jgi:carboxylesterase